jgi:hypothetical protein
VNFKVCRPNLGGQCAVANPSVLQNILKETNSKEIFFGLKKTFLLD